MTQIMKFPFDESTVRTSMQGDVPLFVANDVAKALGYRDFRHAVRTYCRYVRVSSQGIEDERGQIQYPALIPESDVFRLITRSKLPSADRFMDWVCDEVLPTIRQSGHYVAKGSHLDTMMQRRTIGYLSLWKAYGSAKPPTDQMIGKLMRSFDNLAQASGLPEQFEGVSPDPEMYRLTPALARHLVETYSLGRQNGGRNARRAVEYIYEVQGMEAPPEPYGALKGNRTQHLTGARKTL